MTTDNHRNDIDGLRAISVLGVLLYHLDSGYAPGGFVGVDVFFVISGYLISGQILAGVSAGRFSIIGFYERRARRILPAFFFVTSAIAVAAWFMLLPSELVDLAKSMAASLAFAGNVYFWSVAGYFGPAAQDQPLLHYWSLGVEEQFYILFPIAVLLCVRFARQHLAAVILTLLIVSLAVAEYSVRQSPEWAFYLLPARAWELLVGSVLAFPRFPIPPSPRAGLSATVLGVAMILAAMLIYSDETRFPGLSALLPCVGAAAVLWGGLADNAAARVLGTQPLRYVGLISYSLYLVHWPLIVFIRPEGLTANAMVMAAAVGMAALSYHFVEQPFRLRRRFWSRSRIFASSSVAIGLMATVCAATYLWDGIPSRLPENVRTMLSYNDYAYSLLYREGTCFLRQEQGPEDFDRDACIRVPHADVIIWGDSHAAHYYPGLKQAFEESGMTLGEVAASGCAPIVGRVVSTRPNCLQFSDFALSEILAAKPDFVVLASRWILDDASRALLATTIERLRSSGIRVVVLGDGPIYDDSVPTILAKRMMNDDTSTMSDGNLDLPTVKFDRELEKAFAGKVRYVSVLATMCPNQSCPMTTSGGIPTHWDRAHLTEEGSLYFARRIAPAILDQARTAEVKRAN